MLWRIEIFLAAEVFLKYSLEKSLKEKVITYNTGTQSSSSLIPLPRYVFVFPPGGHAFPFKNCCSKKYTLAIFSRKAGLYDLKG